MSNTDGCKQSRFRLDRRDFLALSSAAALGVAASGFGAEITSGLHSGAARPFTVGFTDEVLSGTSTGLHRLVAAERLTSGHHYFDNGLARVTVHGFWSNGGAPQSVAVAAYFADGARDLPFLAWSHVQGGRFPVRAPRASFRVPVSADGTVALGFDSREPRAVPRTDMMRRLADLRAHLAEAKPDPLIAAAADAEAEGRCALRLRRGTYVVAFGAKPHWTSLQLALDEPQLGTPASTPLLHGSAPVRFDYLLFSIDKV
jgi:hypothetical protein